MEHPARAPDWAAALQESNFAFAIRDSTWIYPTANLSHILGLALLVGSILILDLRVLGIGRWVAVEALSRLTTPFSIIGICLSLASGAVLFSADAAALAGHPIFRLKMAILAAALANALLFRWLWQRQIAGGTDPVPAPARLQAVLSGLAWLSVASCGRLIAYF
ncbi:DUF6644 family protein [Dongia sedimenti]|uniref:DUF6644 domain-containing protein n=1 Tax=Dongia sedimenti TaxID=3064282 RepID=A0ABU0YJZ3_9PROT|nr:hypothetical protein [Rhodospirillaceae bacterium R-7]